MQAKANLKRIGKEVSSTPEITSGIETAIQLRLLTEKLYDLLEEAHTKSLGYLLPVAFRMLHESKMAVNRPPTYIDLIDDLTGQEIIDFEHAGMMVFGDEPEPDIDEPVEEEDDENEPF